MVPAPPNPEDIAVQPPRRWLRLLLPLTCTAVLAAGVFLALWLPDRLDCGGFGSDLERRGGECVGVTDGSYAFLPRGGDGRLDEEFRTVQRLIKEENTRVAAEESNHVSIGLLAPLTPSDTGPQAPERALRALEGAYTAQMRADHTQQLGDRAVQIRLYLANVGARHDQWQPAAEQLAAMTGGRAPLVAVVGLAVSTEDSRAAASWLSDRDIPQVAASARADGLNDGTIPGLVRVTGSNTDFVTALHRYMQGRDDLDKAILVHDRNVPDLHVATLTKAFASQFAEEIGDRPNQPFAGTTVAADAPRALFNPVVGNICLSQADTVLFSGRTGDLGAFLEALEIRPCRPAPVTVLFTETGPVIEEELAVQLAEQGITVAQASATDPGWTTGDAPQEEIPVGYPDFDQQYRTWLPHLTDHDAALHNGYAVANHDALAIAVRAVRVSHAQDPDSVMTSVRVRNALFVLQLDNVVRGASGSLSFTEARAGDPGGKPIPVIESPPGETRPRQYLTPLA